MTKKKKNIIWLIVTIVAIAAVSVLALNLEKIKTSLNDAENNPFNTGDKVYLKNVMRGTGAAFVRLARPLTDQEIDNLNLDALQKTSLKKSLAGAYPEFYFADNEISNQTLIANKSGYIGNYSGKKIITQKLKGQEVNLVFYAISPNERLLSPSAIHGTAPLGYTAIDDHLYIYCIEATNTETFK